MKESVIFSVSFFCHFASLMWAKLLWVVFVVRCYPILPDFLLIEAISFMPYSPRDSLTTATRNVVGVDYRGRYVRSMSEGLKLA